MRGYCQLCRVEEVKQYGMEATDKQHKAVCKKVGCQHPPAYDSYSKVKKDFHSVLRRLMKKTPAETVQDLIKAGILTNNKELTEHYKPGLRPKKKVPKKKPILKRIHVNQHNKRKNRREGTDEPVITIKTSKSNTYAREILIKGPSKVVYRPEKPLSCGADIWIETTAEIEIVK